MDVVVTHTPADYYAAVHHITRRMFATSPTRFIAGSLGGLYGFFLAIAALLLGQFLDRYSGPHRDFVIYALGCVILAFVFGVGAKYIYKALAARLLFNPNGYSTKPQRFSIEPDALVHESSNSSARFAWTDIERTEVTSDYIFVFLDRGVALYIAKRAFQNPHALNAFLEELNARVTASKT